MDAETLKALKASIRKWQRNAKVTDPAKYLTGPDDCPLCWMFQIQGDEQDCNGCPVKERTGVRYCNSTPYIGAATAHWSWRLGGSMEAAHAAARDEVAFLKSLLPAEEAP